MKKQSHNDNSAGQSTVEVRKSQKHEVNLQKNSTLYFQIGLILCLLGTFFLFEMRFVDDPLEVAYKVPKNEVYEVTPPNFKVYEPEAKIVPKEKSVTKIIDKIDVVDNEYKETLEKVITQEQNTTPEPKIYDPGDFEPIEKPVETIHITAVQFAPIFPGCEKYELNSERSKCLNEKLGKLVKKKFDTDIAVDYGLSGVQRINVEFKVDTEGNITEIRTRSPHPQLDKEALRIANKIPKMQPGKMGTTPVNVIYNLPITFKVQD